jgi:hypothetical protein
MSALKPPPRYPIKLEPFKEVDAWLAPFRRFRPTSTLSNATPIVFRRRDSGKEGDDE